MLRKLLTRSPDDNQMCPDWHHPGIFEGVLGPYRTYTTSDHYRLVIASQLGLAASNRHLRQESSEVASGTRPAEFIVKRCTSKRRLQHYIQTAGNVPWFTLV